MFGIARNGVFQCSSASRKFLNSTARRFGREHMMCFSALQRAENSSIENARIAYVCTHRVSVLFSEPKIPQSYVDRVCYFLLNVSVLFSEPKIPQSTNPTESPRLTSAVSVLFSEPKIPQCLSGLRDAYSMEGFSALQRAENSSMNISH